MISHHTVESVCSILEHVVGYIRGAADLEHAGEYLFVYSKSTLIAILKNTSLIYLSRFIHSPVPPSLTSLHAFLSPFYYSIVEVIKWHSEELLDHLFRYVYMYTWTFNVMLAFCFLMHVHAGMP